MTVHHHRYAATARLKARKLRKHGLAVTVVRYSDKTYGVYSYKEKK